MRSLLPQLPQLRPVEGDAGDGGGGSPRRPPPLLGGAFTKDVSTWGSQFLTIGRGVTLIDPKGVSTDMKGPKKGGSLADVICVRSLGPHLPPQEYKDGRVGDDGDDERHVERAQCRVRLCRCGSIFQSCSFICGLTAARNSIPFIGDKDWGASWEREKIERMVPYAFIGNLLGNSIIGSYLIFGSII